MPRLVISPAIMAIPVVTSVSQATRLMRVLSDQGVENAVGNLIGQFVGMPHADRFAGEQEFAGGHEWISSWETVERLGMPDERHGGSRRNF